MRLVTLPFAAAVVLSVVVLFTPGDRVPIGPWWSDDVVHLSLFALLAATGALLPLAWPLLAAGLAGYAALSEVVHAVAPLQRSGSVVDLAADLAGIAVGLVLAAATRGRRGQNGGWSVSGSYGGGGGGGSGSGAGCSRM